jgi:AcrR family transcriptional regulator
VSEKLTITLPNPPTTGDRVATTSFRTDEIFEAVLGILAERSYQELDHSAVSERTGVDPELLRCRWPNRAELAVDALVGVLGEVSPEPADEGLRAELLKVAERMAGEYAAHGDVLVGMMTELRRDPDLDQAFRERFLLPRLDCARKVFGRAMLRGELRPEADPRLVLSIVPALLAYRVMLRDPAPDDKLAERVVDAVLMPLLARS